MNNELINFHHEMFGDIRAIERDGEPWFVGKDVAVALGYSNASKAVIVHVDEEDKQKVMLKADSQNGNVVTATTLINESGLYSLVLCSQLPQAKVFKHWATAEVLPSIRRHGALCRSTDVGREGVTKHSYRMMSPCGGLHSLSMSLLTTAFARRYISRSSSSLTGLAVFNLSISRLANAVICC